MAKLFRAAAVSLVLMTALTGLVYPLVVTGLAQLIFPGQANGSLIATEAPGSTLPAAGLPAGSALIGQPFDAPKYFWGRPSATGPVPNTAFNPDTLTGSSGGNLGPLSPDLQQAAAARLAALRAADPENRLAPPVDLLTASASGLDPHISPAAAEYQMARVARVRGLDAGRVRDLVRQYTESRTFELLGEPRVNVLRLNLALDALR